MSDFIAYTSSDTGSSPQMTHPQTLQPQPTTALLQAEEMQGLSADGMFFEELLLATGSLFIVSDEKVADVEDVHAFDVLLPPQAETQTEEMAQQFLASLVNRDVPMLMTSLPGGAAEQPVSRLPITPSLMQKTEAISLEPQDVKPTVATEQRHVPPLSPDAVEPVMPKAALTPSAAETLRLAGLHAVPVTNVPVISTGQPQVQINAPIRADGTGQALSTQLQHALGERLNLQINNQIQHATIRLDPPDMGRIEIVVQIEAGKIQVQINAGQSDVYRALSQVSHELRQALTEQHFVDVDVRLSNQAQQQHSDQRQRKTDSENEFILANNQPESMQETRSRDDKSILMTV